MLFASFAATGNPGAIFGFLAIFCWLFLLCTALALPITAVKKNRRGVAVLSAFLLGGLLASVLMWQTTRPEGLSFRNSLRAGLTNEGLREYGHPIEHRAEVAICFSTYAYVLCGAICAGAALAALRVMARRRTA
ncbi:MAG TPA: hypothetical protein VN428_18940 [Bryobacteraceae bacterium]|nr:hypothetical protein [Bryobacteraceae bacterium]